MSSCGSMHCLPTQTLSAAPLKWSALLRLLSLCSSDYPSDPNKWGRRDAQLLGSRRFCPRVSTRSICIAFLITQSLSSVCTAAQTETGLSQSQLRGYGASAPRLLSSTAPATGENPPSTSNSHSTSSEHQSPQEAAAQVRNSRLQCLMYQGSPLVFMHQEYVCVHCLLSGNAIFTSSSM